MKHEEGCGMIRDDLKKCVVFLLSISDASAAIADENRQFGECWMGKWGLGRMGATGRLWDDFPSRHAPCAHRLTTWKVVPHILAVIDAG